MMPRLFSPGRPASDFFMFCSPTDYRTLPAALPAGASFLTCMEFLAVPYWGFADFRHTGALLEVCSLPATLDT